jgi:hypothetical protein
MAGFGLKQTVPISSRVRLELKVTDALGRFTSVVIWRGKQTYVDSYHVCSPDDLLTLCRRFNRRTGEAQGGQAV